MAEPGKWFCAVHAWLFWVNFPGVQVKNKWLFFLAVDGFEGKAGKPVGEEPKIAATGNRDLAPEDKGRGNGVFEQAVDMAVGKSWGVGDAVGVVIDREYGRIVGEAEFLEDDERPE